MKNQKKTTRIIALILAFLMIAGVATIGISLLAQTLSAETEQTDPHAGHNH